MNALDYFGIIFVALILAGSAFCSFYLYVRFYHPMDTEFQGVILSRVLIVSGLTAALMMIFILPIDLLSTYKERNMPFGFNFEMTYIWTLISMVVIILYFVNNYFFTYYKNREIKSLKTRLWATTKFHLIMLVIYLVLSVIIYMYIGSVNFTKPFLQEDNTFWRYSD